MGRKSPCDEHHDLILKLTAQGVGRPEIAQKIGVSHPSLAMWMDRRGLRSGGQRGPGIRIDRQAIRARVEQGLTQQQIAEALDCSVTAIERAMRKMGLTGARTGPRAGAGHPDWQGGRKLDQKGYVDVLVPLHPLAKTPSGYVFEHRLVVEAILGRYLLPTEVVDHRDNHPLHNWPDNLRVYATNADHLSETLSGRERASPRPSTHGATWSSQQNGPMPSLDDTLAQCSSAGRRLIEQHIAIHQPTSAHRHLPKSKLLRSGPHQPAFQDKSMDRHSDCPP